MSYLFKTELQKIYPDNTPPACYKTNCDKINNPTAYIDPISRENQCDITVCQNIFEALLESLVQVYLREVTRLFRLMQSWINIFQSDEQYPVSLVRVVNSYPAMPQNRADFVDWSD